MNIIIYDLSHIWLYHTVNERIEMHINMRIISEF